MLVRFSTRHGQLLLLGESAVALLRLGGHSGSVPGAVLATDLPEFQRRLRAGLDAQGDSPSPALPSQTQLAVDDGEDDDRPATITLAMRAVPFIDLVATALSRGTDLMWERG